MGAGEASGVLVQPDPEIEAVTLPETPVPAMVPVIVPLRVQLLQVRPKNGMEKAPLLTAVVPEELAAQLPLEPGTAAVST